MKITIAERLRPFSHSLGSLFPIPGTPWRVQIYPTRLIFSEEGGKTLFFDLEVKGPVKGFTAELDLERGRIRVWGEGMRYALFAEEQGIWIDWEKGGGKRALLVPCSEGYVPPSCLDRLSLGMHKAQEWEKIKGRLDLKELFPLWLRIAQSSPQERGEGVGGMWALLDTCRQAVVERRKVEIVSLFRTFFQAAFEGVFVPRAEDTEFQGIVEQGSFKGSVLALLTESAEIVRSLFFVEDEGVLLLLPCVPPEFHCGRWLGGGTRSGIRLSMEWTKKCLRQVSLSSETAQAVTLKLPKGLVSCRVGQREKVKVGKDQLLHLELAPRGVVWIDRLES